ncbi:MAG: NfeD family protein [Telluria sp.]
MADWMTWAVAAGVAVLFELFTGTFYLLMIALGLLAGSVAAFYGSGAVTQALAAALVGGGAAEMLRRRRGARAPADAARDPNVNMDIGQSVTVDAWSGGKARVMYRGALWDVELAPGAQAQPGSFRITEIRGSTLLVQ